MNFQLWLKRLWQAFLSVKPVPSGPVMPDEHQMVSRYAHRNVLLKSGRILTQKEYEMQKKRVLEYKF